MTGRKLHGRQRSIRDYFDCPEDEPDVSLDTRREVLQVTRESANTLEVPAQHILPSTVAETPNDTEE